MNEEKIIKKLFEHDDRFEKLEKEIGDFRRETLDGQEQMITILKRLDQERIFTAEWIRRIEADVETNKMEVIKIKQLLKVS